MLHPSQRLDDALLEHKIERGHIFLAFEGDDAVAYLRLTPIWDHIPYIALIVVEPSRRCAGIGRSMLAQLAGHLRESGHRVLWSSSQANEPDPQRWHRGSGFKDAGLLRGINPDGSDEVFFRMRL